VFIWQACRVGAWLGPRSGDPGEVGDAAISHRTAALPERRGSLWGGEPVGPDGWGSWQVMVLVVLCGAAASQGLKGRVPEGQGSQWVWIRCRAGAWCGLRGTDPGRAWIQCEAGTQHGPRGREPGGVEQWLHRPMWWGLCRPAALLLDHGVKKSSMI
jgi:hypothetical protein